MQRKKIALTHLDSARRESMRSKWDNCSSSWQQIIQRAARRKLFLLSPKTFEIVLFGVFSWN
jgi:hypothetical protein